MAEGSPGNIQKVLTLFSPPGSAGKKVASFPGAFRPNRLVWSPDGGKILLSVAGQPSTIWSFEMRGGGLKKIAEVPSFVTVSPAWLSDNRRMLIAWPTEDNSRSELWVLDTETGRRRPALIDAEDLQFPAVSAGGTLAFTSGSTDSDLVELPLDGSAVRPLLATKQMESGVGWSPVSPELIYVSQGSIRLRRRDGSSERTIVSGAVNTRMKDGPLTQEELQAVRERLRKMSDAQLVRHYEAGLQMCQLDPGKRPSSASFVQQLVQAWRELVRRRR